MKEEGANAVCEVHAQRVKVLRSGKNALGRNQTYQRCERARRSSSRFSMVNCDVYVERSLQVYPEERSSGCFEIGCV